MYHVPLAFPCIYECIDKKDVTNGGEEEGREWRLPRLLYADDLILYGGSEEDLRAMVGYFVEVCRRRGLKVNAGKRKVVLLGGQEEYCRKVASGRSVAIAIRSLVNAKGLQLECARVLHESLLIPVLTYCSETMIWKEKVRSRMSTVKMDNLRGLLGIRRMDKVPNPWIKELCRVMKGVDKRIDEGVLRWLSHVK